MSAKDLESLEKESLARHAQEGWDLANKLRGKLEEMKKLAWRAIDLLDRGHGGHSYESFGSQAAKKCCQLRMDVDEVKKDYVRKTETLL